MKDFITQQKEDLQKILIKLGYEDDDMELTVSDRPDLGDYQYNGAMNLAKKYKKNPREIATEIAVELKNNNNYENINIAGPGFINISLTDKSLINYVNQIKDDVKKTFGTYEKKRILLDYGGANVAKALHVGHFRSANIGEALKRLTLAVGYETVGDVHLGDWGLPLGMVLLEIKNRFPNLNYFSESYDNKNQDPVPITNKDLEEIYPIASKKAKENEELMKEAKDITVKIQEGNNGYYDLWKQITDISKKDIKKSYDLINTNFDYWYGESDSQTYIEKTINIIKEKKLAEISDGALIMKVNEADDNPPLPPVILQKSDGAALYHTTELATLLMRMEKFKLDEIWYLTDIRQKLHFTQTFRAAYKSEIVPNNIKLEHIGFGTMNGKDGKPFKTRDGGVMSFNELYINVYNETYKKLSDFVNDDKKSETAEILAVSAIKYADLLPNRATDYIFDPEKFCDMNGKTGPYLLYSTIRIKSLLSKNNKQLTNYNKITTKQERLLILELLKLPEIINKSLTNKTLNEICEFLYNITNIYNNFYAVNRILDEENQETKSSWLTLSNIIYNLNCELINILGIDIPEKM